jgi:hypothetical protein
LFVSVLTWHVMAFLRQGYATAPMKAPRPIALSTIILAGILAGITVSCGEQPKPEVPSPPSVAASGAAQPERPTAPPISADAAAGGVDPSKWRTSTSADDPTVFEAGGLRGPKPASWVWTKPSMQFRTLQYAVAGDVDSIKAAELIVSVFVAGDGGPIDANINRWKGQFRKGDASPEPKLADKELGPLKVKFVELEGDYLAMGAPAAKKDFSQIGAIVQAPGRNVFFRLIGPKDTVEANRADFMKMIDGLMPAD